MNKHNFVGPPVENKTLDYWLRELLSKMREFIKNNPKGMDEIKQATGFKNIYLFKKKPIGFCIDLGEVRNYLKSKNVDDDKLAPPRFA